MTVVLDPSFRTLAPLAHCEGIARGPDGCLWTASEDGAVWRLDPADGATEQVARVDGWPNGVCVDGAGRVYLCLYEAAAVARVDPRTGEVETYCGELADGTPLRTPNFPLFAADGTLYVSLSGTEDLGVVDGRIVAIPRGGGAADVLDLPPLHFANGLALAGEGTLFAIESFASRVVAIRDGEVEPYAELPRTVPDGLAFDAEGGLLVSCYQPNAIFRVPPGGGEPELLLEDWTGAYVMTPTNIAFFGDRLESLAIASLGGYRVTAITPAVPGAPLAYPEI